ncbi:MAG: 30S ribosomal protein S27ae [Candidatus Diapherotrites archaeon]|nr:30S ribosomal protein S27ae [Candidatus Diapherotrites archaeon]
MAEKKGEREKKQGTKPGSRFGVYTLENDHVKKKKFCPKCGAGIFMAEHSDRSSCGKCGYTEWKKH